MISISDKHTCCGCGACAQRCPKQCISMKPDDEGFLYPRVDEAFCIGCDLCEKVCPCLIQGEPQKPIKVYSVVNPNEAIRKESSSGGAFTMIAEEVINEGGVVFGARFNDSWEVIHTYTESKEGLEAFRGSKYVQSRIGDTFIQASEFLKKGRKVLFTGTPCQIAGLKLFLRKEYENLLTIDVVCHGVPSPLIWRDYLTALSVNTIGLVENKKNVPTQIDRNKISRISFRDKISGWKKYSFVVRSSQYNSQSETRKEEILLQETLDKNLYLQLFLRNLDLRPSCYTCPFKSGKCKSDFTLGDFWGYSNEDSQIDDDKGISLVLVNTKVAKEIIRKYDRSIVESTYDAAYKGNVTLEHSAQKPKHAAVFWSHYHNSGIKSAVHIIDKLRPSLLRIFISRVIKRMI